ncbi:zinc finger protein 423-like isoform X2 [Neocloeon triangulifer]|uniref:zinc finger protein 423-like isoform X2 n=1 Tax=Neocloeon triangulifer TaxID=2078957 RepID=UPI00286EE21D|nr:zinc finger protein 423-like isoform X2 [Neocloeon triangulifer]
MESTSKEDNNVFLLKDILDADEQQYALEVYSEMRNDEFEALPEFPDEIHIDINLYPEEITTYLDEVSTAPKRITAANQVLPLLTSVYEDRGLEEDTGLASEWREVFQSLSTGVFRSNCECLICKCFFVTPSLLLTHVVKVHSSLGLKEVQFCYVCRQRFIFPTALSLHLEQHHGLLAPRLTCSVCFMQLNSQSELKAHERKHALTEACRQCFSHFPSRQQLAQHVASVHAKPFPCSNCRKSFEHEATYKAHLARHKTFQISICINCKWCPSRNSIDPELTLLEHLHGCLSPEQLQSFFSFVLKEDKQEQELEKMLKLYHEVREGDELISNQLLDVEDCVSAIVKSVEKTLGDKDTKVQKMKTDTLCKLCSKAVIELDKIPEHVQEFHPKSKQCPICKNRFPSVKRAQAHTRLHLKSTSAPKEYNCRMCSAQFKDNGKLNRHLETTHMINVLSRPYNCHVCKKSFYSANLRDKHVTLHSLRGQENVEASSLALKCSFCNRVFIKPTFLTKHIEKYHNRSLANPGIPETVGEILKCNECGELMDDLSKLKRHVKTKHCVASDKNRFQCNICKIGCSTAVGLKVHMRTHTNERPYECIVCSKRFNRVYALNKHIKRVHEISVPDDGRRKVFCCTEKGCPHRQSSYAAILKHYLRAHRDVKRFICGICGECYCQNQELKIHMLNKHKLTAPNVIVRESSKQTDIHVYPSIVKLPPSHPHAMLITQIMEDQHKKTLNLPKFPTVQETMENGSSDCLVKDFNQEISGPTSSAIPAKNLDCPASKGLKCQSKETIIYDTSASYGSVVPNLESIAAPNTSTSLKLASVNNETYLSIINQAYETMHPKYPEVVAAVVNLPPNNKEFGVVTVPTEILQPIIISTNAPTNSVHVGPRQNLIPKNSTEISSIQTADGKVQNKEIKIHRSLKDSKLRAAPNIKGSLRNESELCDYKIRHQISTDESKVCPDCPGRVYKRLSDLRKHMNNHQEKPKSYLCHQCGAVLTRRDSLLLHQARKHSKFQYKCAICKKGFKIESQYHAHQKSHSGNKEHKCDICGRAFALRNYLLSHLKRHTKQKNFLQCPHCPRKFSSNETLQVHEKCFHTKGAMLQSRQRKQDALQKQEEAQKATLAANLEDEMLQVDFDLEENQVVYLKVLSDADLAFLPS